MKDNIKDQRRIWEKEYSKKGILWRGHSIVSDDIFKFLKDGLVLDLGCGNGKTTIPIFNKGLNIIGLDSSSTALKMIDINISLIQGNVLVLPFKENSFGSVLLIHLLDHFLEPARYEIIENVYKILKEEGLIFVEVFTTEDFRVGKGKEIERFTYLRGNNIFTHYFSEEEMRQLLNRFNIINIIKYEKDRNINKKVYKKQSLLFIGKKSCKHKSFYGISL